MACGRKEYNPVRAALAHLDEAPFDHHSWRPAIKAMTAATHGSLGQLIGWGGPTEIPANIWSEPFQEKEKEWVQLGGTDPAINPVVVTGIQLGVGRDVDDVAISARQPSKPTALSDWYARNDLPHLCMAKLLHTERTQWMLVALSSAQQGAVEGKSRAAFRKIGKAAAKAIRAAHAIADNGTKLLAGALDALSATAFVFDRWGRVIAMSEKADGLARRGHIVRLQSGMLHVQHRSDAEPLERAIFFAARHRGSSVADSPSITLSNSAGLVAATAQAVPLPRDRCDIGLGATGLLIVDERIALSCSMLRKRFGLAPAESEVALSLLERLHTKEIAQRRDVSPETVRSQAKAVYAKLGVSGQRELIAKLGRAAR